MRQRSDPASGRKEALRPRLINLIGGERYRGLYSLLAIAILAPMIIVFARHKHAGPMLWYLREFAPARLLTWLLMFAALMMMTAGVIDPSPSSMVAPAGGGAKGAHGVLKLTRHPAFVAFSLFGFAHMLMNGWAGDGHLLIIVLLGPLYVWLPVIISNRQSWYSM